MILLMEGILHQLIGKLFPIIYKVLAPSQVVQDFFHQQYDYYRSNFCWLMANQGNF